MKSGFNGVNVFKGMASGLIYSAASYGILEGVKAIGDIRWPSQIPGGEGLIKMSRTTVGNRVEYLLGKAYNSVMRTSNELLKIGYGDASAWYYGMGSLASSGGGPVVIDNSWQAIRHK